MSMLPESSAQAIIDHMASPPPPAPDYRGRLALLLWELWRDGILSEQQCAKRFAVDLVTMRRVLDMYALRDGHRDRMSAVERQRPRVPPCAFAVFDEEGIGADDRVQDYAANLVGRLRIERDHARAMLDGALKVLTGIHSLLYPAPITTPDGRTMVFRPKSPDPHEVLQELSDRIRALPEEMDKLTPA